MNLARHVRVREERFGAAVFETLREKVFVTNTTGARILQLIKEGKTVAEMTEVLAREYDEDPARIATDVTNFMEALKENNVLV